jgi:DNA polymerase-3 subunit epsilon
MDDRRIIVFDVETTGTDKARDQIVELCVQFGVAEGAPSQVWRIMPSVPMSPGAQEVHGISIEDLRGCPSLADLADEIRLIFEEARVLVGYNLAFDIDMIQAELARLDQPLIDLSGKHIVDAFRLWQQCEPRSLQDAHRRFVGEEFVSAHSASADVAATGRVLRGMVSAFGLDPSWSGVARVCEPDRSSWVGPSRHLQWSEAGHVVLGFGRYKGTPLAELAAGGPDTRGYLGWVVDKDFPPHVGMICRRALEGASADELAGFARERFGAVPAAPVAASGGGGESAVRRAG